MIALTDKQEAYARATMMREVVNMRIVRQLLEVSEGDRALIDKTVVRDQMLHGVAVLVAHADGRVGVVDPASVMFGAGKGKGK